MEKKIRNILLNSFIMFLICVLALFLLGVYSDYSYYRNYSKERLKEIFSIKTQFLWNIQQAIIYSINLMKIFIPILAFLEIFKMKNCYKIIISVVLSFIFSVIYILLNLTITF